MLPSRARLAFSLLVAPVLAACSAAPPPLGTPGTDDAPRAVTVIMRDYLFEPQPIRLIPGETVRFTVLNAGLVPHDFVLGDDAVQAAWEAADAAATPPIIGATAPPASAPAGTGGLRIWLPSGGTASADFAVPDAPAATQLTLTCRIPGHLEEGMRADLAFGP